MCEWKDNKHIMRHNVGCYESSTFFFVPWHKKLCATVLLHIEK